jgi:hypothetical protein
MEFTVSRSLLKTGPGMPLNVGSGCSDVLMMLLSDDHTTSEAFTLAVYEYTDRAAGNEESCRHHSLKWDKCSRFKVNAFHVLPVSSS